MYLWYPGSREGKEGAGTGDLLPLKQAYLQWPTHLWTHHLSRLWILLHCDSLTHYLGLQVYFTVKWQPPSRGIVLAQREVKEQASLPHVLQGPRFPLEKPWEFLELSINIVMVSQMTLPYSLSKTDKRQHWPTFLRESTCLTSAGLGRIPVPPTQTRIINRIWYGGIVVPGIKGQVIGSQNSEAKG